MSRIIISNESRINIYDAFENAINHALANPDQKNNVRD